MVTAYYNGKVGNDQARVEVLKPGDGKLSLYDGMGGQRGARVRWGAHINLDMQKGFDQRL